MNEYIKILKWKMLCYSYTELDKTRVYRNDAFNEQSGKRQSVAV